MFDVLNARPPTTQEGLAALISKPADESLQRWRQLLLAMPMDPWARPYQYRCPAVMSKAPYEIYSLGRDGVISRDDIGTW